MNVSFPSRLQLHRSLSVVFAMVSAGCSASSSESKWNASIISSAPVASGTSENKEAPVSLDVKNAFISGGKLHVNVVLESRTDIPSDSVAVYVRGLKEGKLVSETVKRASESALGPVLESGSRVAFQFELDASTISEYQAACSWGDEAVALFKGTAPSVAPVAVAEVSAPNDSVPQVTTAAKSDASGDAGRDDGRDDGAVRLSEVFIDSNAVECATPPCDILYTLRTDLMNDSPFVTAGIRLALSINWANSGETPSLPEEGSDLLPNEDEIVLGDVVLAPGESKQIRLAVDKPLPVLEFGSFIPHLRLVDYKRDRRS
ncbi:MAG: hypothetical protein IT290_10445 [Deltaproteobacteria bacterium]|nr:hypothetical protein [Deltaproteobacteria bacterium]